MITDCNLCLIVLRHFLTGLSNMSNAITISTVVSCWTAGSTFYPGKGYFSQDSKKRQEKKDTFPSLTQNYPVSQGIFPT